MLVDELFVHSIHIAYLAATNADVTGGNVTVGTEVLPKAEDKRLAEAHDFTVALATGREIRTAFRTTHRECGQSVLESLLETEEFQNRKVDRRVEADTTLVRADGVVELHAVTDVVLHVTIVVKPGNTECDNLVRLDHTLDDFVAFKLRMLVVNVNY